MKNIPLVAFFICTLIIIGIMYMLISDSFKRPFNNVSTTNTDPNMETIDIKSERYMFSPTMIRLKKGKTYKVTLSTYDVQHGIFLQDLNIDLSAYPGKPAENIITPDKVGEYTTSCSLYCGVDHDKMKLTFIVYE